MYICTYTRSTKGDNHNEMFGCANSDMSQRVRSWHVQSNGITSLPFISTHEPTYSYTHAHTHTHTHAHTHAHTHGLYIMYTCIVCQHGLRCTSAHIRMYLATALINSSVTRHYKSRQNERNAITVSEGRQVRESGHTLAMGINEGHNIKCALSASNVTNACISY